jgi:hypothetical protein
MNDHAGKDEKEETPDDRMSPKEKEALADHIEEFEGPDRREIRGEEEKKPNDPGVSHS